MLAALLALAWLPAVNAQGRGGVEARDLQVRASGLTARFPEGFACAGIASPYASPTRFDGSRRRPDRNGGLHGGIDLSLPAATPLLAIADGDVIAVGEGGQLEGIFLWLRIAPADSGLPFWTFAKYQHLDRLPALLPGTRVRAGEEIARSGNSGTVGGYYGAAGYPHLHLSTSYGASGKFTLDGRYASMVRGEGARHDDPLLLYAPDLPSPTAAGDLPEARRELTVPIVDPAGWIVPAGRRTVWPVACRRADAT